MSKVICGSCGGEITRRHNDFIKPKPTHPPMWLFWLVSGGLVATAATLVVLLLRAARCA